VSLASSRQPTARFQVTANLVNFEPERPTARLPAQFGVLPFDEI
jgi:hypothetical protein